MAGYPPVPPPTGPPVPPPGPPPGYDPRAYRRYMRDQARAQRDMFRMQRQQMRYQMRGLRRGSVLGPLLLIAAGIVILLMQSGRLDHQRFWGWYGHWWPVLLVGAGLVLLAEWAIDQFVQRDPQHPRYRRAIGGGVVVMLLIFGVAGVIASNWLDVRRPDGELLFRNWGIDRDDFDELLGDKHESDQTLDLALPAGGSLTVMNPRGNVTISGTSDDGRVHLAVHKQIYSRSDSDADAKTQQFSATTSVGGTGVSISMPTLDGARGDLTLTVPAAATTTVTLNHGDIHVTGIKAPVFATANHGDIELSAVTGQVTAHINSGGTSISAHSLGSGITIEGHAEDVTLSDVAGAVSISGDFFGTTRLQHVAGPIRFHTSRTDFQFARLDGQVEFSPRSELSADQVLGPVVVNTSNHNISLDRVAGDISVTDRNGSVDVTAAPSVGNISLEDRNGSIKVVLPGSAGFSVQANTTNGDTYTDFPIATSSSGGSKSISGTVGVGGPLVHITTSNGDVTIDKGDVMPLPPNPPAPPKITLAPAAPPSSAHPAKAHDK